MPDWTKSMTQTFEYYIVDPGTWKDDRPLTNVKSCTITRDATVETLGSATFEITESVGECYIRVYLITIQNGVKEKHPLGTFLVQTPTSDFDGKVRAVSMDAYTPLLELRENPPPVGYYIPKDENVMDIAYRLTKEHVRAPVVKTNHRAVNSSDYAADPGDTWLSFLSAFISNHAYNDGVNPTIASYTYALDEMGRILFAPKQDTASLQPVWTYTDDNSSILYPDMSMAHDLYGIPNVVEVVYSDGTTIDFTYAKNDDPNSPTSIRSRGREITYRDTNPSLVGNPTKAQLQEYTDQLLRTLSTVEYTISYTHGYCPVRLDDCVRFNYSRNGLNDIKAKVISQTIKCVPGCPVSEKAVFTTKLWK